MEIILAIVAILAVVQPMRNVAGRSVLKPDRALVHIAPSAFEVPVRVTATRPWPGERW